MCPVLPNPYIVKVKQIKCKFCKSPNVVKRGIRTGIQYYTCKDCDRTFAFNSALYRMRKKKEAITETRLDLLQLAEDNTPPEKLIQTFLDRSEELTGSHLGFVHTVNDQRKIIRLENISSKTMPIMKDKDRIGKEIPYKLSGKWRV